jgi:parallel beta-helix repeat protein
MALHAVRGSSTLAVALLTASLTASVLATAGPAAAANCGGATPCSCGDSVTADRTLTAADPVTTVVCTSGLALGVQPGVALTLGGRTITGTGSADGVTLDTGSSLFGPGTIHGCGRGVVGLTFANGIVVTDVTASASVANGFDFFSDGNTCDGNLALANGGDGILLVGSGNVVTNNVLKGNSGRGALVGGGQTDNIVKTDRAEGNGGNGLDLV